MSEQLYTHAGTKIFISQNPVNSKAEVELSDFASTVWIEIKGLYNVGEIGGEQTINTFEPLAEVWARKAKGGRDGGTMTNTFIPMALDPGQLKFKEAIENCRPYQFKIERGADCSPEQVVTITTDAEDPAVVTWAGHGFVAGQPITFQTEGALPTGITANTVYYVLAAGLTASEFTFATEPGGTAVVVTSAGTGDLVAVAPPAGMTQLFQGLATDGSQSGGAKNDLYTQTWPIAIDGRVLTV